eukprot:CAMPEP_0172608728 /NCGR_PEP_ID=MMETSP1068-20121228/28792_1 /TAXON_ID=35684 /ORGANISM="Pseudopedinella elastica, Strain CCMP716" /LENGTH=311 /DNA_ID=CAMNT_0013412067 /DNA_START=36 /DNA_END=968 /DNA_ORIENTATION=-
MPKKKSVLSTYELSRLKKERVKEIQRRLEKTRQEEKTRRIYGSIRAWSFLALIGAMAANVAAIHRLTLHKQHRGEDTTDWSKKNGVIGAWARVVATWDYFFVGCVDWGASGGFGGEVADANRRCRLVWLNFISIRCHAVLGCFIFFLLECQLRALQDRFRLLTRPVARSLCLLFLGALCASDRRGLGTPTWENTAAWALWVAALIHFLADTVFFNAIKEALRAYKRRRRRRRRQYQELGGDDPDALEAASKRDQRRRRPKRRARAERALSRGGGSSQGGSSVGDSLDDSCLTDKEDASSLGCPPDRAPGAD